jgi:hypothetical protein
VAEIIGLTIPTLTSAARVFVVSVTKNLKRKNRQNNAPKLPNSDQKSPNNDQKSPNNNQNFLKMCTQPTKNTFHQKY